MAERKVFRPLSGDDIVNNRTIVTSGLFQDGVSSINTFFTSSVQSGSTGDYSLDVYRFNPSVNASVFPSSSISRLKEALAGKETTVKKTNTKVNLDIANIILNCTLPT